MIDGPDIHARGTATGIVFDLTLVRDLRGEAWPEVEVVRGTVVIGPPVGIGWHCDRWADWYARGYGVTPDGSGRIDLAVTWPEVVYTDVVVINHVEYAVSRVSPAVTVRLSLPRWAAGDFNCDGFVNGDDADGFDRAFNAGAPEADWNGDGFVNGDDADGFSEAFARGQP